MVQGRRILLVDWPSRDVPEALARAGYEVLAQEGPDVYAAYEMRDGEVMRSSAGEPAKVDAVYAYRPLDELPAIVELALHMEAATVWWETAPVASSSGDLERARSIVEGAGLDFRAGRPPVEA